MWPKVYGHPSTHLVDLELFSQLRLAPFFFFFFTTDATVMLQLINILGL